MNETYLVLAAWISVVLARARRAVAGVGGRSVRQQRAYGAAVITAPAAVSVLQRRPGEGTSS